MEVRHLQYFVVVAEELHFGRAASRLQMTQPPLSQQILQLEEEIGVRLLERSKRKVELTHAGSVFLDEAKKALAQIQRAADMAQRADRGQTGRLAVGFVGSATYDILPEVIRVYMERFPDVDVVLNEMGTPLQISALINHQIDVGIVRMPISQEGLSFETVLRTPCVAAVSRNHPLAVRSEVSLRDLAEEPFIFLSRAIWPGFHDEVVGLCRQAGFSPSIRQEATEFQTILGLVAADIGISIVPASAHKLPMRGVVYLSLKHPPVAEMAMAWRSCDSSPMVREFLGVARQFPGATEHANQHPDGFQRGEDE